MNGTPMQGVFISDLTNRERQILVMVADGLRAKEIARKLKITDKAVEFHKSNLYAKIGVRNAIGAVRFAIREGHIDA